MAPNVYESVSKLDSMAEDVHITPEGLAAVRKEHDELTQVWRPQIAAKIKAARELGDLSENFEYHAAKNEQGLLEARIRTLRARLDNSVLVDESTREADKVGIGSLVEIEDGEGSRMAIEISNVTGTGTASPESPLGRAVIGHVEGDTVEVDAPGGSWSARILAVTQPSA